MDQLELAEHRNRLRQILKEHGVRDALIYLNGLTHYRFTALYRFDDDMLRKTYFFDRTSPESEGIGPDIPIEASYCIYLRRGSSMFATENSLEDERVAEHPKRTEILSYCGVPLTHASGEMFGSVCHFDFEALPTEDCMVELMESLASMLSDGTYLQPENLPSSSL